MLTHRWERGELHRRPEVLAVEEPLEIHLDGVLVATTMRTPGHDFELAAGFCHTEGLLAGAPVRRCRYCGTGSAVDSEFNVVTVETGGLAPTPTPRLTATTSACGMCGTTAVDELRHRLRPLPPSPPIPLEVLASVGDRAGGAQRLFDATGGVHAAMAFDAAGDPVVVREDVGRHNAVDKVIGWALRGGRLPLAGTVLMVSGRASFELTQKAMTAGVPVLAAVSAPSSLAVDLAEDAGMTLVGFLRGETMNVYTGAERIAA